MQHRDPAEMLRLAVKMHNDVRFNVSMSNDERMEHYRKVEYLYNWVLEQLPDEPSILGCVGGLYMETEREGIGLSLLHRCCEKSPHDAHAWNDLGVSYRRIARMVEARKYLKKAIELEPGKAEHYVNLGGTFLNENSPKEAMGWFEKALKLDPNQLDAKYNLGFAYLEQGDYEHGWPLYDEARRGKAWRERIYAGPTGQITQWNGEPGKTVIVYGEQGVGDEIMYASCLQDIIDISEHVILDCHPRLVNLFKRSFPTISVYGTRKDKQITWPGNHPGIENAKAVPIGSLPVFFRAKAENFPESVRYIVTDPELELKYSNFTTTKMRIGLSWMGGTKATRVEERSIVLEKLKPLFEIPGIEWVSLQYADDKDIDEAGEQVRALQAKWPELDITHDRAMNADLDSLFACIAGLDLTINVLNSNIHFAGSLGKESWILAPIKAPWQFAQKEADWYPQHKIYRQAKHGHWDSIISRMSQDLRPRVLAHQRKLQGAKPADAPSGALFR